MSVDLIDFLLGKSKLSQLRDSEVVDTEGQRDAPWTRSLTFFLFQMVSACSNTHARWMTTVCNSGS